MNFMRKNFLETQYVIYLLPTPGGRDISWLTLNNFELLDLFWG